MQMDRGSIDLFKVCDVVQIVIVVFTETLASFIHKEKKWTGSDSVRGQGQADN